MAIAKTNAMPEFSPAMAARPSSDPPSQSIDVARDGAHLRETEKPHEFSDAEVVTETHRDDFVYLKGVRLRLITAAFEISFVAIL